MTDFLLLGESLFDIIISQDGQVEHVGGSPLNVAVGLRRQGYPVRFATYFGRDERGQRLVEFFAREGIEVTDGSQTAPQTSIAQATLDASGAASYEFSFASDLADGLAPGGHLHAGSISATTQPGAGKILRYLQDNRAASTVSYDPNVRPTLMGAPDEIGPHIEAIIETADVVKSSDEDVEWLYPDSTLEEVLAHWHQLGPQLVVITRGGEGAIFSVNGEILSVAAPETTVVDTVGAGDSFMAGLLGGLAGLEFLGNPESRERLHKATVDDVLPAISNALSRAAAVVSQAGAEGSHSPA